MLGVDYLVYRVVAVTNAHTSDLGSDFSTTSYSYCTPHCQFWLIDDDLGDPKAPVILLEIIDVVKHDLDWNKIMASEEYIVEFEYDGGRYTGTYALLSLRSGRIARKLGLKDISATVRDISSM